MWTCGTDRHRAPRLGLAALLAALWALPCAAASSAGPQPKLVRHKVRSGQTLAGLALDYYGDRDRYESLARINGIEPPFRLKTGRIVRIPLSAAYHVSSGDTPSGIAQRLFGGASRHALLMELNGLPANGTLSKGQELEIPAVLEHVLGRGETLGGLAARYYGDASRAPWIALTNGITRPDLVKRGTRVEIPLIGFLPARASASPQTRAPERTPVAAASAPPPAQSPPKGSGTPTGDKPAARGTAKERPPDPAVQRAMDLYHEGEYRQAATELDRALERGSLEEGERAMALRYRAYCAVATGDVRTAKRTFRALNSAAPAWKPDSSEDSPKIRRAFAEAVSSSGS